MARSRSKSSRPSGGHGSGEHDRGWTEDSIPDDIELLNVHRYPESAPAAMVAFVRNSKACQKRLEDLLKGVPGRRDRGSLNQLFQEKLADPAAADEVSPASSASPAGPPPARYAPAGSSEPESFGDRAATFFRKIFQ